MKTLLLFIFIIFSSSEMLFAQSNNFTDIVVFKNGSELKSVKATAISDSYVVTAEDGNTIIFKADEISEVKKDISIKDSKPAKAKSKPLNWSGNRGFSSWRMAKSKCSKMNMRLPTIEELKDAYSDGITESWKGNGNSYWSSTDNGNSSAYNFDVHHGNSYADSKRFSFFVRCVK